MGKSLTYNILEEHLVSGEPKPGNEIGIRIDQTLTQDATGTMAYLQFEAMGIPRVRTKLSVSYVDHNMLQAGFENADDHRFLQSIAAKYGIYFSRPGNGICHQVHLERFAVPGGNPAGLRQPHAHLRRGGHAGHRRRRAGRGRGHGRRPRLHHRAQGRAVRAAAAGCSPGSPARTSSWRCCAA